MEHVSRVEAKASGLNRFFTGRPCRRGHVSERYTDKGTCIACSTMQATAWRAANPALRSAIKKKWYQANKDLTAATCRIYYIANKATYQRNNAAWQAANPIATRCKSHKRRAAKSGAGGFHTPAQVVALEVRQKHKCAGCRASIAAYYEKDHVIPIALGGSNNIANIQLLCMPCNRGKGAKDPIRWAQENGRLV